MPMTSITPKNRVKKEYQYLEELEQKCSACECLKGVKSEESSIYYTSDLRGQKGMLAYAVYKDISTYAVYIPEEEIEENSYVFEFFMRDAIDCAEEGEKIIVFSSAMYDALQPFNEGPKKVDIINWLEV